MKSGNKEIGFGKQSIDKVFEEWYTVPPNNLPFHGFSSFILLTLCKNTLFRG